MSVKTSTELKDITNPEAFGLQNYMSICWLNSISQALMSLPSFCNAVCAEKNIACAQYAKLLLNSGSSSRTSTKSYDYEFLRAMTTVEDGNGEGGQKSAVLGFQHLLALMPTLERLFNTRRTCVYSCICGRTKTIRAESTFISICDSSSFQDFLLGVRLGDIGLRCDCGLTMTHAVERVTMLNDIIVIVVNKTNVDLRANGTMTFPKIRGGTMQYDLMARIDHSGTTSSGHYWAYGIRGGRGKEQAYCFNDSSVTTADIFAGGSNDSSVSESRTRESEDIVRMINQGRGSTVQMLFYQLKKD